MIYIRRIPSLPEWASLKEMQPPNPSLKLYKSFVSDDLSVYKVADEADAFTVAAAMCLSDSNGAIDCVFACADCEVIDNIARPKKSDGGTGHKPTDERHYGIQLRDALSIETTFKTFLSGDVYVFQAAEVRLKIKALFFAGEYDLKEVGKSKDNNKPGAPYGILRSLVAELLTIQPTA